MWKGSYVDVFWRLMRRGMQRFGAIGWLRIICIWLAVHAAQVGLVAGTGTGDETRDTHTHADLAICHVNHSTPIPQIRTHSHTHTQQPQILQTQSPHPYFSVGAVSHRDPQVGQVQNSRCEFQMQARMPVTDVGLLDTCTGVVYIGVRGLGRVPALDWTAALG